MSAPSAAQEGRPLDVSTITSVVRQERTNSHAVIVRFRSERAADQFLDEFGTIVLGERAAAQEGKQSSAQGQGESK